MKKNEFEEIKAKTVDELVKLAQGIAREVQSLSMDMKLGKIKNLNEVRIKQKHRARLLTIIHEKMKGGSAKV